MSDLSARQRGEKLFAVAIARKYPNASKEEYEGLLEEALLEFERLDAEVQEWAKNNNRVLEYVAVPDKYIA